MKCTISLIGFQKFDSGTYVLIFGTLAVESWESELWLEYHPADVL